MADKHASGAGGETLGEPGDASDSEETREELVLLSDLTGEQEIIVGRVDESSEQNIAACSTCGSYEAWCDCSTAAPEREILLDLIAELREIRNSPGVRARKVSPWYGIDRATARAEARLREAHDEHKTLSRRWRFIAWLGFVDSRRISSPTIPTGIITALSERDFARLAWVTRGSNSTHDDK